LSGKKSVVRTARAQEKRRLHNRVIRGQTRTILRSSRAAVASGDAEQAQAAVLAAKSSLDRAASKGVFHKNKAARLKSRLAKRANAIVVSNPES